MSRLLSFNIVYKDYFEEGRIKLAIRLCILFSAVFLLLSIAELFNSTRNFITYLFCTIHPLAHLIFLLKTKRYDVVYFSFCITGTLLAAFTLNTFVDEVHFGDLLWMVLVTILAFWGLSRKMGLLFLGLNLISVNYYFLFNAANNFNQIRTFDHSVRYTLMLEVSIAMVAIAVILLAFVKFYRLSINAVNEMNEKLTETNQLISTKNLENITLLKEVHHRVKNNLQIITSLLRLQKETLPPEAEQKIEEAINRIMTMALIHRKLYQSNNIEEINLESYIDELLHEISQSVAFNNDIELKVNTNYNSIGLKTIVPLGLILNELISNSYKHAFEENDKGFISISINKLEANDFEVTYTDSGTWRTESENNSHFGLELIETLTEQLEGSMYRKDSTFYFKLKNLDIS